MSPLKLAILISGRGSNMLSLLEACETPAFPAQPVMVLSNRPYALGLDKARSRNLEAVAVDHKTFGKDREAFERAVDKHLEAAGVDLIALAGFMRVLTPWFVNKWQGRLINIHPSLLPKYPGLHTHQRALDAGDEIHGCTVHWVTEEIDAGAIISQDHLTIQPDDTADTLAKRLLPLEHQLYARALKTACEQVLSRR